MPAWLNIVLQIIFFAIIFLVVYTQLKVRVLVKFHPNKWSILATAVMIFFVPTFIAAYYKYNLNTTPWQYLQSALFIIFFLWFMDLQNGAMYRIPVRKNIKNDVVIKPKAKPNRANKNSKK
jgi:hypothetical protein